MLFGVAVACCFVLLVSALPHDLDKVYELEKRQLANVITQCTVPNTVALTFDDGPYSYIYAVDGILRDNGGRGTFFFNGDNWGCIYDQANVDAVKFVYNNGHQVASHTWYHKDLTTLSWDQIHDEMWRVELALLRITGAYPAFMRPPYGNYNDLVRSASAIRGQSLVLWDFDSGDSVGLSPGDSKNRYHDLVTRHPSTALALNHETLASTVYDVLPYAVQQLRAAGYRLVTLAECLGAAPYQSVAAPQQRTGDWHC
jgi:peptidoglycan/xylan/chitin deacetylase (PgdA/CDA1 family)